MTLVWEKHYSNGKLPGVQKKGSFWWKANLKILNKFKELTVVQIHNGRSCLLWEDNWMDGPVRAAKMRFPELHSFSKNNRISVDKAVAHNQLNKLFHIPMSAQAFSQLQVMMNLLENLNLDNESDLWSYAWGSIFSASKAYKRMIGDPQVRPVFGWLWKTYCQPKHKAFFYYN